MEEMVASGMLRLHDGLRVLWRIAGAVLGVRVPWVRPAGSDLCPQEQSMAAVSSVGQPPESAAAWE
jgi:hypothetical protein